MKTIDLQLLIESGAKPVVTFTKAVEIQDGYLEEGMRGKVTGAYYEDDNVLVFDVDLTEFTAFNVLREKATYFDKNHNPCLTATQAGYARLKDSVWADASKDVACELVEDARTRLFEAFRASGSTVSYLQWLEDSALAQQPKGEPTKDSEWITAFKARLLAYGVKPHIVDAMAAEEAGEIARGECDCLNETGEDVAEWEIDQLLSCFKQRDSSPHTYSNHPSPERAVDHVADVRNMVPFGSLSAWWAMVEAQAAITDCPIADDATILSFMGSGASTTVSAGDIRKLLAALNLIASLLTDGVTDAMVHLAREAYLGAPEGTNPMRAAIAAVALRYRADAARYVAIRTQLLEDGGWQIIDDLDEEISNFSTEEEIDQAFDKLAISRKAVG